MVFRKIIPFTAKYRETNFESRKLCDFFPSYLPGKKDRKLNCFPLTYTSEQTLAADRSDVHFEKINPPYCTIPDNTAKEKNRRERREKGENMSRGIKINLAKQYNDSDSTPTRAPVTCNLLVTYIRIV